jgi:large subunit ribosomal protein L15
MKLNDLAPNLGAKKNRKRVGHGNGAGQGKTAGRGTKGQSSRSGFGGALYRQGGRLPFMRGEGFTPPHRVEFNEINLDQLAGFTAGTEITPELLASANLLSQPRNPVVILGRGELTVALKVMVQRVTAGARAKIEAAGGSVVDA